MYLYLEITFADIYTKKRKTLLVFFFKTKIEREREKQGHIHGQYQLWTGGQGRKCLFLHFSTRGHGPTDRQMDGPTDRRTDNGSYRVACPQLTRPDTLPIPVADGWAGAEMRVFTLSNSITTDQPTNGRTDKASYRVAIPRLKRNSYSRLFFRLAIAAFIGYIKRRFQNNFISF